MQAVSVHMLWCVVNHVKLVTLVNVCRFSGIYANCRYFIDRKW